MYSITVSLSYENYYGYISVGQCHRQFATIRFDWTISVFLHNYWFSLSVILIQNKQPLYSLYFKYDILRKIISALIHQIIVQIVNSRCICSEEKLIPWRYLIENNSWASALNVRSIREEYTLLMRCSKTEKCLAFLVFTKD